MEEPIIIFIPYFCYNSSKGALKKRDQACEKIKKANSLDFLDIDFAKNLFKQKKGELYNQETFVESILAIFGELEGEYGANSWIYINSFKRLISLKAKEMDLIKIIIHSTTFLAISNIDVWFDFVDNLYRSILEIDGIYGTTYFNKKRTAFCLASETEDGLDFYTEIMISDIKNYWDQKSF
jgi:hypothetical protein